VSEVKSNPAMSRFEMASGGGVALVKYERTGHGRIALLHRPPRLTPAVQDLMGRTRR